MKTFKNGNLITPGKTITLLISLVSTFIVVSDTFAIGNLGTIIFKWIAVMSAFIFIMQLVAYYSISYIIGTDSFGIKIGPVDREINYDDIVSIELLKKGVKLRLKEELGIVSFDTNKSKELFDELNLRLKDFKIAQQKELQNRQK